MGEKADKLIGLAMKSFQGAVISKAADIANVAVNAVNAGANIVNAAASMKGNKLAKETNSLLKEASEIELTKWKPNLSIKGFKVERSDTRSIVRNKIMDINNMLDIDPDAEEDFIFLTLENTAQSVINRMECKAIGIHAGDFEEYENTGDGRYYDATKQITVEMNLPADGVKNIYLLAGNQAETIIDYLADTYKATLYIDLEISTELGTYNQCLSCCVENMEEVYGTYTILE